MGGNIVKTRAATRITIIGLATNLLLASLKFSVGFVGHSQAVIADAVHSLSDLATDVILLIGIRYWALPPDECHPYGHRRIETLIAGVIGAVLAFVAINLMYKAVITLVKGIAVANVEIIALIGPGISIVLKECLYRATAKVGRDIGSSAIIANAFHHRSDALSSIPALVAVILASMDARLIYFDSVGSIVVSILILKSALEIIRPNIRELVDGIDSAFKCNDWIKAEVMTIEGVQGVHGIRTRTHGGLLLIDLHILVDPNLTIRQGHDIAEKVKQTLLQRDQKVVDVMVHVEPYEKSSSSS